jgi:hypothetical protein
MQDQPLRPWQQKLHTIIFEADTTGGKLFDVALITLIALSVAVVMLESVSSVRVKYGEILNVLEWVFTILFSIEYILRLISVGKPANYALSFFGIVDLLAVLPTYLSLFIPGSHYLLSIRVLRLLRIFRVFNNDNCWLWRFISANYARKICCVAGNDSWLQHSCCADGNRVGRIIPYDETPRHHNCMPAMLHLRT